MGEEQKKQRGVLMTDAEYAACTRICGPRGFSAWARRVLIEKAFLQPAERGSVPGGSCAREGCPVGDAWFFAEGASQYMCAAHAAPLVAMNVKVEDQTPGDTGRVRQLAGDAERALCGLANSPASDGDLGRVVHRLVSTLTERGRRDLILDFLVEFARAVPAVSETAVSEPPAPPPPPAGPPRVGLFDRLPE